MKMHIWLEDGLSVGEGGGRGGEGGSMPDFVVTSCHVGVAMSLAGRSSAADWGCEWYEYP